MVDSKSVGEWTTARNLSYVRVYNSSRGSIVLVLLRRAALTVVYAQTWYRWIYRSQRTTCFVRLPLSSILAPLTAVRSTVRFMEVDTLHAAGHSAKVPSRIGAEVEAVIGATLPNGTTLPSLASPNSTTNLPTSSKIEDIDGFDRQHEAFYGPRRTVLVFLLLLAVIGFFWGFLRWRRGMRGVQYGKVGKRSNGRKGKGKGRGIRLEENEARNEAREVEMRRQEELEREERGAPIFDLGEEEGESSEDDGDIGHSKNPWQERR